MNNNEAMIVISGVFGIMGFFITFYMRRLVNIVVFVVFLYGSLLILDNLYMPQNWCLFHAMVNNLIFLSNRFVVLIKNLLSGADSVTIFLFLIGGVVGILIRERT